MSPACCAPASATAPATRLAITLPGAMPANTTYTAQEGICQRLDAKDSKPESLHRANTRHQRHSMTRALAAALRCCTAQDTLHFHAPPSETG